MSVAERSGELLSELVPTIGKTAALVQEVASASREQALGVAQINRAMSQVDSVTQQNASASEELASTAEELAAQAESLQQIVSAFRISADQEEATRHTVNDASRLTIGRVPKRSRRATTACRMDASVARSVPTRHAATPRSPSADASDRDFVRF